MHPYGTCHEQCWNLRVMNVVETDNAYERLQQSQAAPTDLAIRDIAYFVAFWI
jgi:hypothetical protein